MKEEQILKTIEDLSHSQGFYGRLLRDLKDLKKDDPEEYKNTMNMLESQNFKEPLDLVLFAEG